MNSVVAMLLATFAGVLVATIIIVHSIKWCINQIKQGNKLSKPVFMTALSCMIFAYLYLINETIIVIIDLTKTNGASFGAYYWICNNVIFRIAKFMMYLFFFARFVFVTTFFIFSFCYNPCTNVVSLTSLRTYIHNNNLNFKYDKLSLFSEM